MEKLSIPNLTSLRLAAKDCVDRPATISEVLRLRCTLENKKKTLQVLNEATGKLSRHDDRHNIPSELTTLSDVVRDLTGELTDLVAEDGLKPQHNWYSSIIRHHKNRYLRTVETFDMKFSKELMKDAKDLMILVRQHHDVIRSLRKTQKICWISKDKVEDTKVMLMTAVSSAAQLQGKIPTREEQTRRRTIGIIENRLKAQEQKYKDHMFELWKISGQEETIRRQMVQLSSSIKTEIHVDLVDRLKTAISSLKELCERFLPEDRLSDFSQRLANLNVRGMVKAILSSGQSVYTFPVPFEHIRLHGFETQIPKGVVSYH